MIIERREHSIATYIWSKDNIIDKCIRLFDSVSQTQIKVDANQISN